MYKKIVVPLDGTKVGESVLPQVEALALRSNAEVSLIRATKAHTILGIGEDDAQTKAVREAETYIESVANDLRSKGVKVSEASVWYGDAAWAIIEHANYYKADVIIMGSKVRRGVNGWLNKTVARRVFEQSELPVLINGFGNARAIHHLANRTRAAQIA